MKELLHSIIVPVYQSRSSLETLVRRVSTVMNGSGIQFELILVDDGSQDDSFTEIRRLSSIHPFIRGVRLSRNFGHQAAVTVGLQKCNGEIIAIVDDDLQDPPEILPHFFECLHQGTDVVYGVRKKRKENIFKRAIFSSFYRIINAVSSIHIPEDSGDFCAMRRCVVNAMLQMPDANPFLRGTRAWAGFRQVGFEYERLYAVKIFQTGVDRYINVFSHPASIGDYLRRNYILAFFFPCLLYYYQMAYQAFRRSGLPFYLYCHLSIGRYSAYRYRHHRSLSRIPD
jgi:glycosyltransferase involved in cell wall biosynthesis